MSVDPRENCEDCSFFQDYCPDLSHVALWFTQRDNEREEREALRRIEKLRQEGAFFDADCRSD